MARTVQCVKLGHEAEGLDRAPFPNDLGKRIFESISKDAWKQWLAHSTMLINEYRVDLSSKSGTEFLLKQAEEFFFGGGGLKPEGYVPPPVDGVPPPVDGVPPSVGGAPAAEKPPTETKD